MQGDELEQRPTQSGQQPVERNYDQPVAYDADGRPLYARPLAQAQSAPQVVHVSRAVDPIRPQVSPEAKRKHDESVARYPSLNLSEQEYIIAAVRRHPIGLFVPIGLSAFLVLAMAFMLGAYPAVTAQLTLPTGGAFPDVASIALPVIVLIGLFILGGYIASWVYLKNRFFLTNESVIQETQVSLFSHDEQTVSLANIEDVSFEQKGIIQTLFNYGSIRLSTEGDETTYRFGYVAHPKQQVVTLNNAVEAFKNGRPVDED